jgi:hypothetical protein
MMQRAFTRSNALRNISRQGTGLPTLALTVEPTWTVLQPRLTALNIYTVAFRYPGSSATKSNAANALKASREVRRIMRQSFGLAV